MTDGHFIEYWACGCVASQCRCPAADKDIRHRSGKCAECRNMTPVERRLARAALIATVNAIPTKPGVMFGTPHGEYMLWEGCAEMEGGEEKSVVLEALLHKFDVLYPEAP